MYLLYIDESGTKDLHRGESNKEGNSEYFVLGAVLIKAEDLSFIEHRIQNLKSEYLKDPYQELKSTINQKKFKKDKSRQQFLDHVHQSISESTCYCFGAQVHKPTLQKEGLLKTKDEIYKLGFQHILSSVNSFMKHKNLEQSVTVFIDQINSAHNKKVYIAYKEALESQAIDFIGFDDKHFSPSINFVDSEFTIGVQIADAVAGALWRGVEKKQKTYSRLLLSKFPRDSNNKYVGYSYQVCEKWK
ncbi:TPA: DUF3800 domain-containing protein [Streptococcus pyogenes]|nr:DUF3800 domain-containing protein [Streptococcus pyogenes]HER0886573.1 DUF3800 domain-containing protein [Streptococcus pyogenes]HER0889989.1 DUF3800 domain-containing protein [Streptococcus pyogenes]HER0893356.1 DUF3800 domain-containing protein [Streptococcus pyogenes]